MNRSRLFEQTFINMAQTISALSTCPRANVGAVLVRHRRVISMGFNGSPKGTTHCTDAGCLIENNHCVRTTHAEQNAIVQAALHGISTDGATLYCTHRPCLACTKILINAGIREIVFRQEYDAGRAAEMLLKQAGVEVRKWSEENGNCN